MSDLHRSRNCWTRKTIWGLVTTTLISHSAYGVSKRNALIVHGQGGMATFSVYAGSTPVNTSVVRAGGNYFITPKTSISGSYYSATNLVTAQTLLSGFDFGSRMYLFSPGVSQTIRSESVKIEVYSALNHYLSLQYVQRNLTVLTTQVSYSGFSAGYGVATSIGRLVHMELLNSYYLNLQVSYESMSAPQRANASTMNFLAGLELSL